MEKVVYFIGAGFSAPLGLPVMNNFLVKSKDMFSIYPNEYKHFRDVFDTIQEMSVAKNYYETDLFNIEEILSILEMEDYLQENKRKRTKTFQKYLADVIEYYTPKIDKYPDTLPGNYWDYMFGKDEKFKIYGFFLANILNLHVKEDGFKAGGKFVRTLNLSRITNPEAIYSIITLNYDMIFENIIQFTTENYKMEDDISFINPINQPFNQDYNKEVKNVCLAKLHGSINPLTVVPPTWNKGSGKKLLTVWHLAHNLLREANHIRILGYSLPTSDSYVQYLLKSAVLKAPHLKFIDVICLDPNGSVRERYDNFIKFNYYRFKNSDILDYHQNNFQNHSKAYFNISTNHFKFDRLEEAHRSFMKDA